MIVLGGRRRRLLGGVGAKVVDGANAGQQGEQPSRAQDQATEHVGEPVRPQIQPRDRHDPVMTRARALAVTLRAQELVAAAARAASMP
jgi:hypothetical protein